MAQKIKHIAVIGDGGWGTTLAIHLAQKRHRVTLWGPFPEYLKEIKAARHNAKFLPGIKIPKEVQLSGKLEEAIGPAQIIILAVPSQYIRPTLHRLKPLHLKGKSIVSVIKGIDTTTLERMSQIVQKELGKLPIAVLSGPTIAREVAKGLPSTAVIATKDRRLAKNLQMVFNSKKFRIYTNTDVAGVELGGSIKNVIAIACGVCDGLGFGTNAKSAIVSRGLAEMARLGIALGGKEKTFYGLTGLGDLITTCVSPQSRNRYVGEELGKGKSIEKITSSMSMIAEGIVTAKAVYRLSRKFKIAMPITKEVYSIIYRHKKPKRAVADLMGRQLKAE